MICFTTPRAFFCCDGGGGVVLVLMAWWLWHGSFIYEPAGVGVGGVVVVAWSFFISLRALFSMKVVVVWCLVWWSRGGGVVLLVVVLSPGSWRWWRSGGGDITYSSLSDV